MSSKSASTKKNTAKNGTATGKQKSENRNVELDEVAIAKLQLIQAQRENERLKFGNEQLQKQLKFSDLQLQSKEQDLKDLQGELARRFLATKESLLDKIASLQTELFETQTELTDTKDRLERKERDYIRLQEDQRRLLDDKDRFIERILLISERMVAENIKQLVPKLYGVHNPFKRQDTEAEDNITFSNGTINLLTDKERVDYWLQSFRRDLLLMN